MSTQLVALSKEAQVSERLQNLDEFQDALSE